MKKLAILLVSSVLSSLSFAQELTTIQDVDKREDMQNKDTVGWVHSGNLAIGFNEGILHNWAAGGELASLTVNGLFSGNLTYYHNRSIWSNQLDASYGLFYAYSNTFVPRKTDDRIDFTSKYGYRLHPAKDFYFVFLANLRSQFTKGYDYSIPDWRNASTSKFLSPLYVTLAPGVEYRKGTMFNVFFSPAAARFTFVDKYYTLQNPAGAYGVEFGKTSRVEFGAYLSARFQKEFTPTIMYKTRLDLYSNYLAKDVKDDAGNIVKKDNPGNIDIMWDNFVAINVWKMLALNFGLTAIYDNDLPYEKTYINEIGEVINKDEPSSGLGWWQVKQVFSIGLNYKF